MIGYIESIADRKVVRQIVAEGRASGEPVDGETELKRLRAKYAAMAENNPR